MLNKADLRQQALQQRQALSSEEVQKWSAQIISRLIHAIDWKNFHAVHVYLACEKRKEIATQPLLDYLWCSHPHIVTLTNKLNSDLNQIDCYKITPETKLVKNRWGILEPEETAEKIDAKEIDLMILPLLACDQHGFRLGYGKGYYDQLLSRCAESIQRIGINYFSPLLENIPHEAHDVKLSELFTSQIAVKFEGR